MTSDNEHIEVFSATATSTGWPTRVSISGTDWILQLDEPTEDGGSNSGANPMQYFIASLAGCQNEQAQVVAEELSLIIDKINLNIEIDLDLAGFMGQAANSNGSYKQVRLNALVKGKELTESQIKELGMHVDARCPILGLLRSGGCAILSNWQLFS